VISTMGPYIIGEQMSIKSFGLLFLGRLMPVLGYRGLVQSRLRDRSLCRIGCLIDQEAIATLLGLRKRSRKIVLRIT
jgi:hypothetical protein